MISALLADAVASLLAVSPFILMGAVAVHLLKVGAEARAWHGIVRHAHGDLSLPFVTTLVAFVGSIGANAVLPARVGEALRVAVIRRRLVGSSVTTIAATILVETLLELVFAAAVMGAALFSGRRIGSLAAPAGVVVAHPLVVGLGVVAAFVAGIAFRPFIRRQLGRLARAFSIFRAPRALAGVFLWKVVAWSLRVLAVYLFLLAFHIPATFWTVLLVIVAQTAAAAIPITPGNAGTQQAAFAVVLAGVASASGVLGFGVGMQAATALADVAVGVVAVTLIACRDTPRASSRLSGLRSFTFPG